MIIRICYFFSLSGLFFFVACKSNSDRKKVGDVFPVTTVVQVDTVAFIDYVADLQAEQNVEIRARVGGYLEQFYVDEGANVREGQILFAINNKEYSEELSRTKALKKIAQAEVKAAELELKNVVGLFEKKIVSETEVELAKNKLEMQKAKLEEATAQESYAKLRLANTEIKAPFHGVINKIHHKIGSLIEEGSLLTVISECDEIFAYFNVSEKEYLGYAKGILKDSVGDKTVSLILADGTEHSVKGKIETVEGAIDYETGNIAFRARFANPGRLIKHGASGRVRISQKFKRALLIPQKSTIEMQDRVYVYVVDNNNTLRLRAIEILYRLNHFYIIKSGLKEGEKILYEGLLLAKDGLKITPKIYSYSRISQELVKNH